MTVDPDDAIHLWLAADPSVRLRRSDAMVLRDRLTSGGEVRLPGELHGHRMYGGALNGRVLMLRIRPSEPHNTVVAVDGDTPVAGWDLTAEQVTRLHDALAEALAAAPIYSNPI